MTNEQMTDNMIAWAKDKLGKNTAVIEGYPLNVDLCKKVLLLLGIDFKEAYGGCERLPFDDGSFDIVTNRHGSFRIDELRCNRR